MGYQCTPTTLPYYPVSYPQPPRRPTAATTATATPAGIWFGIRDDVWLAAWPDYRQVKRYLLRTYPGVEHEYRRSLNLCFSCLTKRLGRPLEPVDFDLSIPINNGIHLGLTMALQNPMTYETELQAIKDKVGRFTAAGVTVRYRSEADVKNGGEYAIAEFKVGHQTAVQVEIHGATKFKVGSFPLEIDEPNFEDVVVAFLRAYAFVKGHPYQGPAKHPTPSEDPKSPVALDS